MKLGRIWRTVAACAFLAAVTPTLATPFSVQDMSGVPGGEIVATLFDEGDTPFEAANLTVTFQTPFLSFVRATVGTATVGFSLLAKEDPSGVLLISLAAPLSNLGSHPGEIVKVVFQINAPLGESEVIFAGNLESEDQTIPLTVGKVTVTAANGVSEPASLTLCGLAAVLLAACRRRRQTRTVGGLTGAVERADRQPGFRTSASHDFSLS